MLEIHPEDFETMLKSNIPVVVMFYTAYCPYSRRFTPIFERYSNDPRHVFAKANITDDENPLWERCRVETVPTVIAFKDGKEISRKDAISGVGLIEEDLKNLLQEIKR